jgi:hypothetical protein
MAVPVPPSNATWIKEAEQEIALIRCLYLILCDDSETLFSRHCNDGENPGTWHAFMSLAESFNSHAKNLKARAEMFDAGAARIIACIERAVETRPDFLPALAKASAQWHGQEAEAAAVLHEPAGKTTTPRFGP